MTRKEIIDFLHKEFHCKKTSMKTIKDMMNVADTCGYAVIKNGIEDYSLCEKGVVTDFTKPLKINRETPALANNKMYNGVPVSLIGQLIYLTAFNAELWCYLMNKKDGDVIRFDEILNNSTQWCKTNTDIVKNFDELTYLGFIKDTANYIEVYAYPIQNKAARPMNDSIKRFAPYKFID